MINLKFYVMQNSVLHYDPRCYSEYSINLIEI